MASTTKIMTALTLLAIPGVNLNDYTTVDQADLVGEASMGLYAGETLRIVDLLYGLLLDSGNDAAMTLARYGGSKLAGFNYTNNNDPIAIFVAAMNQHATQLGLWNTNFKNPHGLDTNGHYTSAQDLAVAGWYALHNPTIASIVRQNHISLDNFSFENISNFIRRYPGATGIKPGQTDAAGLCLVASATRFGHTAIVVLLNSPDLGGESDTLMDYAFTRILYDSQTQPILGYIGQPSGHGTLLPTIDSISRGLVHGLITSIISVIRLAAFLGSN
jgi:D-alanyl-D-alanine carboxypeptidase